MLGPFWVFDRIKAPILILPTVYNPLSLLTYICLPDLFVISSTVKMYTCFILGPFFGLF